MEHKQLNEREEREYAKAFLPFGNFLATQRLKHKADTFIVRHPVNQEGAVEERLFVEIRLTPLP